MSIFKTYDIRGIYPDQFDEELIYKIGKSFVQILKEETLKEKLTIVIGRDMRLSSPSLSKKLIQGIIDAGSDVIDIGLVSTPTFYYSIGEFKADGGLQVSASHNPKEYNGVKAVRANAYPMGLNNGLDKVRDLCSKNEFEEVEHKGQVINKENVVNSIVDYSLKYYDFNIKPLKVVADVANAMSSPDLNSLFEQLPCELIKMNFELDGTFPAHQADPFQEKNVVDIKRKVIEEGADLGIATDGDGDRIFFIDDKGKLVEPGIIRGIISKIVLQHNPGSKICYDIRPGRITKDMIVENGGIPIVTKVGHSLIKMQAIKENAPFSGESSGHFFMKTNNGFFECPLIIALIIMDEISKNGKLSEIIKPLQRYSHSGEINSTVEDKEGRMKELEKLFGDGSKVSWLDGISIEHDDYWFNVRASNTEPLLRLNLEATSKEKMEEMTKKVVDIIRS